MRIDRYRLYSFRNNGFMWQINEIYFNLKLLTKLCKILFIDWYYLPHLIYYIILKLCKNNEIYRMSDGIFLTLFEGLFSATAFIASQSSTNVHRTTRLFSPRKLSIDSIPHSLFVIGIQKYRWCNMDV